MKLTHALVSVVDDDKSVRESLPDLLQEFGFSVKTFSSGKEFLASDAVDKTKCLILDVAMPGMTGPELQVELARRRKMIPIVYITAQRDSTIRHGLIDRGAVECLFKPFSDQVLQDALGLALRDP
ncbi:response regulator [Mesorhizobium sp. M0166]|uniref:response regulator n=1 Tax=Mesorhizobium sp. M0166 TaxID=2956902 RepID=UPI00333C2819